MESRVSRLEASMETLAKTVNDLAITVRDNNSEVSRKLDSLAIAVTNAQAPRKTDWSTIIAGAMLILALGSAVFWPLNQQSQQNKFAIEKTQEVVANHMILPMHPVGAARIDYLEKRYDAIIVDMAVRDSALDAKIHQEIEALDVRLQREFNLVADRNAARLTKLEEKNKFKDEQDELELRALRHQSK